MKYKDNPDIESIDISSSLFSKRININTLPISHEDMDECMDVLSYKNISGTSDYFISINVVPFDGFTLYGDHIKSIIEYYIY